MRLNVGEFGTKQLADAVDGELLYLVHFFAAAIPALPWIAFCVFVGEAGALCCHDGAGGEVLRCNEFNVCLLPVFFTANDIGDRWICCFE